MTGARLDQIKTRLDNITRRLAMGEVNTSERWYLEDVEELLEFYEVEMGKRVLSDFKHKSNPRIESAPFRCRICTQKIPCPCVPDDKLPHPYQNGKFQLQIIQDAPGTPTYDDVIPVVHTMRFKTKKDRDLYAKVVENADYKDERGDWFKLIAIRKNLKR